MELKGQNVASFLQNDGELNKDVMNRIVEE